MRKLSMNEQMAVRRDLTHTILSILFICLLVGSTFWVLRPFLVSLVWGTIIVIATWPLLEKLETRLLKKRRLAVLVMSALLMLIVLIPLMFAFLTITRNAAHVTAKVKSLNSVSLPSPPEWLERIPFAGEKISNSWKTFAALNPDERSAMVTPYAKKSLMLFAAKAGNTGIMVVHFLLTMIVSIILYAKGENFRAGLLSFARRLAGKQGADVAVLAGKAVRAVVLGVVITALIQTAIGGIGLFIAGVPAAGLLTAVMLILCLAQLGPILVLVPSVLWLYWSGQPVWGTVLLILSIIASTIDNFLRPVLIRKGIDLPILLIFAGVIGGLIGFGVIGLFIGPVILAVAYTLLTSWVAGDVQEDGAGSGDVANTAGRAEGTNLNSRSRS
jgi:predicted PurR-regulated permease PerM